MSFDPGYFKDAGAARARGVSDAVAANRLAREARTGRSGIVGRLLCMVGLHSMGWTTNDGERCWGCHRCGKDGTSQE